ncbi:hypothetical protein [Cohnella sp. WQ 127256]|uniref:hypothetical protein n=1 Tax=Cohnella sp. WQ 127256 TaxID=2938790 RepID=UPI002118BEB9|nr:hypothetical protein [Cohnella sp. WQ 127256]
MKIAMNIFLLMCFITTGCSKDASTKDEILISAAQIKESFETYYDIPLSEPSGLSPENVFIRNLNGVKPETYTMNENQFISFYVFSNKQEAEKGLKEFENSTAAAELVMHSKYQIANVLLFYVADEAVKDGRVKDIMEGFLVTK